MAFSNGLEGQRAIIDARHGYFNFVDIHRFNRKAICIFARQDHACSLEADIRWPVGEIDRNNFLILQCAAISRRQAGKQCCRPFRPKSQTANTQLASLNTERRSESGTEFEIRRVIRFRIKRRRKDETRQRLFGGGIDTVAEIGEILLNLVNRSLTTAFALASSHIVSGGARDNRAFITGSIRLSVFLVASTRREHGDHHGCDQCPTNSPRARYEVRHGNPLL